MIVKKKRKSNQVIGDMRKTFIFLAVLWLARAIFPLGYVWENCSENVFAQEENKEGYGSPQGVEIIKDSSWENPLEETKTLSGSELNKADNVDEKDLPSSLPQKVPDKNEPLYPKNIKEVKQKETSGAGKDKNFADLRAYVDKSTITIGEKVKYTLEIDRDSLTTVEFPSEANLGGFAVKDFGRQPPRKIGRDRIQEQQWYLLDTYTLGQYVIPAQAVRIKLPDGTVHSVKSAEIFVEVKSVAKAGETDLGLRDIKSPLDIPGKNPLIIIGVAGLLLAASAVIIWILYRKKLSAQKALAPLSAYELALAELKRIQQLELIKNNKVKEYYYLVSHCLRVYLENRFSLRAPEQTTEEFLNFVIGSDSLEGKDINLLKEYLYHCDLVKYAKLDPEEPEIQKLLDTTRNFIEQTNQLKENDLQQQEGDLIK